MWMISIWVEYRFGLRLVQGAAKESIKKSFLLANTLSYLFLAAVMTHSTVVGLSEARSAVASIQKDLTEFDRVCPVIVKSDACDQVFHKRVEAYEKLSRIYLRQNSLSKFADLQVQLAKLREATAKTCSQNDQRVVCKETR